MGLFDNIRQGWNLGGQADPNAQAYQMPRVPFSQNPMITTAALGLLGGRTLNEGLQNVAQIAPAGLAAKTAMQRDMYSLQEKARTDAEAKAKEAGQRAALNAIIKIKSNMPVTPAEQAAIDAFPELKIKFGMPAERDPVIPEGSLVWDEKTQSYIPAAGGVKQPKTPEALQFQQDQRNSKNYATYAAVKPAYESMVKSATVTGGAADLDIVYGMAKLLDPLGAVRDQDTGHIENAAGYPNWFQGIIEGVNSGQTMTTETRNKLLAMASQRMTALERAYENDRQQAAKFAQRRQFDPEDVLTLTPLPVFDPSLTVGGTGIGPDLSNVPSAD